MPDLPAFCDNCGNVFPSGIRLPDDGLNLHLSDNFSLCPRCGSMSRMLEGTLDIVKGTVLIVGGTRATAAQLARLQVLLQNAEREQQEPEEVVAEIERELPTFGALAKQLLMPKNAGEFYSLVAVVIAVIALRQSGNPTTAYTDRSFHQTIVQMSQPAPRQTAKPGRNAPCPCGSGKKYKRCHGAIR